LRNKPKIRQKKMLAVIGREICGWPNIGRKIRLAGRTSQKNSAAGSRDGYLEKSKKEFCLKRWYGYLVTVLLTYKRIAFKSFCEGAVPYTLCSIPVAVADVCRVYEIRNITGIHITMNKAITLLSGMQTTEQYIPAQYSYNE